jgi:hypothetical protein
VENKLHVSPAGLLFWNMRPLVLMGDLARASLVFEYQPEKFPRPTSPLPSPHTTG